MRLMMAYSRHGKTATGGCEVGAAGAESCGTRNQCRGIAGGASRPAAGDHGSDADRDGGTVGGGARYRTALAGEIPPLACHEDDAEGAAAQLGWAAQCVVERRGRSRVSSPLAGASAGGRRARGVTAAGGAGAALGKAGEGLGPVSFAGPTRVAESGPGYAPSQERPAGPGGLEKKLPKTLAGMLTPEAGRGRPVRLMFQDEARFGRMVRIRRCWAPTPMRPVVDNGYEREFVYVYGSVSPLEGELDWMICPAMNTEQMGKFLAQVSAAHPQDFIVMVVDGASSHVAKALVVPENIRLHRLPAYSPELNPQEHLWDELREKEFPK